MAILRIRTFGDPVLRHPAKDVDSITDLHRKLVADMFDTMRDAPGVGLAAPQVGVLERIFVWENEDQSGVLINPRVVHHSSEVAASEEGCLSLPGIVYTVERPAEVKVEAIDENGNPISIEAKEMLARIFQHEIDHLAGILFTDRLPEELRREALGILRNQALGLPTVARETRTEGVL